MPRPAACEMARRVGGRRRDPLRSSAVFYTPSSTKNAAGIPPALIEPRLLAPDLVRVCGRRPGNRASIDPLAIGIELEDRAVIADDHEQTRDHHCCRWLPCHVSCSMIA